MELEGVDCIHLTQARESVASFCEHGNEPSGVIKCWEFLDQLVVTCTP
jgi:hypothetical protein